MSGPGATTADMSTPDPLADPGRAAAHSLRVTQYPHAATNPYQALMAEALRHFGIEGDFAGSPAELAWRTARRTTDVIHIHWTHVLVSTGRVRSLARFLIYVFALGAARLRGIGIVWTVHNAGAHEETNRSFDRLFAVTTGVMAHRVIVQGPMGAQVAVRDFRVDPNKIGIVRHGSYSPLISPCPPRDGTGTRRFLAWGQIRAYKGFATLAERFAASGLDAELSICGAPIDADEAARLSEIVRKSPRISFRQAYLSDAELNDELCRADFVVLPYRDILTSGTLLANLTAGRPVITPRLGDLEAYVDDTTAIFYDPDDEHGALRAIARACSVGADTLRKMCDAARRAGEENSLEAAARATRDEYLKSVAGA